MTPESLEWLLEHTAAAYEGDADETERVKGRATFVLSAVIVPLVGALAYLIAGLKGEYFSEHTLYLFWLPAGTAGLALGVALIFIGYAVLRGFYYSKAPRPAPIIVFIQSHPFEDDALQEAKLGLLQEYSACIEETFGKTERRKWAVIWAQRLAVLAVLFLASATPRWLYSRSNSSTEPQPVRIINSLDIKKEANMTAPQNPAPAAPAPSPTAPASQPTTISQQRPQFPQRTIALDSITQTPAPGASVSREKKQP